MNPLDPGRSCVVEACAGSGKTWLLVSRMIRLLLSGAQFSELLAITFTRKAAQEMQSRLREWLKLMALEPDETVRDFLRERFLDDAEIDLPRARSLYEASLASPMTVTTFHGWFLEILRRAPLFSNLSGANLAESVSALVEESWQRFAEGLKSDHPAAPHLDALFLEYGLYNTRKLLTAFLEKRAEWWACTHGQADPVGFALERLRDELGVDPEEDVTGRFSGIAGLLSEYAVLLGMNTESDKAAAVRLERAVSDGLSDFQTVWNVFFTRDGSLRNRKANPTQEERMGSSEQARLLSLHAEIGMRLEAIRDAQVHQKIFRFNESALLAGHALLECYQALKEEIGVIDFTDVEWRTFELLKHSGHAEYMQYKLDSRYRHILLDEFQDTNPFQWQILKSWLDASNDAGLRPTVFMVGDPKQSIYRFRRAEAGLFDIASDFLEREYGAVRLCHNLSRRSSPVVLECVNRVFPDFPRHEASRTDLPGRVEVLPLVREEASGPQASPELRNPLHVPRRESADSRVEAEARQFASRVKEIVGSYPVWNRDGTVRAARYGDIMALVSKRAHLGVYERALREAGIPYVGSSRGGLLDTLEASDLTALLAFLSAPFADLHLAQVLRSPIFDCADEDLMRLAALPGKTWWERLRQAEGDSKLGAACSMLGNWMDMTDRLPVHDLLDRIYFEGNLQHRYRDAVPGSMQAAVAANLQAYLELALKVDSGRYPSLPKFLAELAELRRFVDDSPDEGILGEVGNALRFHTIHGAKGLESPIVWLLGANASGEGRQENYDVILDWPPDAERPLHFSLHSVKEARGAARTAYFDREKRHAEREDGNLLYVAMTRAIQALFVSGSEGRSEKSWYGRISEAADNPEDCVPAADSGSDAAEAVIDADLSAFRQPFPAGKREVETPEMRYGTRLHEVLRRGISGYEDERLASDARAILESPVLGRFFDPDRYVSARNEVSYVSGSGEIRRMDRLVEFPDEVWILDYKTGEMKASYRDQLSEYRMAMQTVFAKPVRCGLIFTDGSLLEV